MALGMTLLSKFVGFRARTLRLLLGGRRGDRTRPAFSKECFPEKNKCNRVLLRADSHAGQWADANSVGAVAEGIAL